VPPLSAEIARFVAIHRADRNLKLRCSISTPGCASRHPGAAKRNDMDIVATVLLGSIVLYMFMQMADAAD
jgi:hypothetical protein